MFFNNVDDFKEKCGYDIDGIWFPRVTSILSIKAKPALYMYYGAMPSYKAGQAISAKSAEEGTAVHSAVEAILKKEQRDIPDNILPAVQAFIDFIKKNEVVPLKIEERLVSHEHHFAGTIDILAEVNGTLGVLDIKTSQGIYRDYGMQTAAYVQALKEDPNMPPLTSWVLRLDQEQVCEICSAKMRNKGGRSKVRGGKYTCQHQWSAVQGVAEFAEMEGFEHNIKAFLAAKELWAWEHKEFVDKLI